MFQQVDLPKVQQYYYHTWLAKITDTNATLTRTHNGTHVRRTTRAQSQRVCSVPSHARCGRAPTCQSRQGALCLAPLSQAACVETRPPCLPEDQFYLHSIVSSLELAELTEQLLQWFMRDGVHSRLHIYPVYDHLLYLDTR